jgi:hypothetical protein
MQQIAAIDGDIRPAQGLVNRTRIAGRKVPPTHIAYGID